MKVLVTGGAGFIGSAVVRHLIRDTDAAVVNVDSLTYAANPRALEEAGADARYAFERVDITDGPRLVDVFKRHRPDAVLHLAAESHVDRSIDGPRPFIDTNIVGTYMLLETALRYHQELEEPARKGFRLLHVSTDEVYGSLGADGAFDETAPYRPSSPYAASKAAADHLVGAWTTTFGLPAIISNCTNNYGPWQFPEKLIPTVIVKALDGAAIPIYGDGANVRDWLHVADHAEALWHILNHGAVGESYNVGGNSERANLAVAEAIAAHLDRLRPRADRKPHRSAIAFVKDRPGHDFRYALDAGKLARELGWSPRRDFETGIGETVAWYVDHEDWWRGVLKATYDGRRQGLGA
jgi:dTDP-glucose 4,6-dehydratase